MAGIGFELKKAINDKSPAKKTGGYFGAAFSSSGSMIIGILIFCAIQYTAGMLGVSDKTKDMFMCYVTNTMFLSMIISSIVNLVLSRYVSDKIYLNEGQKIIPSLIGGISVTAFVGEALFAIILIASGMPAQNIIMLSLLFLSLICCWILMNYIGVLRDYKKIIYAYLLGFMISMALLLVFIAFNKLTIVSMILVLLIAFVTVDIILFKAVYCRYTYYDESVLEFLASFKDNMPLAINGFLIMMGTLGHFFIVWFVSNLGESVNKFFRFSSVYDFPVIVAFFSTIPASIYFITIFETNFSKKYSSYFKTLGKRGNAAEVSQKSVEMANSLEKGMRNICKIQILSCLLFITAGSQILYVLNIGMTERMLNNYRFFCVGYSVYYIGFVLFLVNLYFVNEKRIIKSSLFFFSSVVITSVIFAIVKTDFMGIGFFVSALIFTCSVSIQLFRFLNKLEYNILCIQPMIDRKRKNAIAIFSSKVGNIFSKARKTPFRLGMKTVVSFSAVILLLLMSISSLAVHSYYEAHTLRYYPKYSARIERSPRMGLAPWANDDDTKKINTSLVYVELKWSDWEPKEGEFDVDYVYEHYNLEYYKNDNRQVVFRFICDEPTKKEHIDIPEWLFEQTGKDGEFYHNSYGFGYSPNYNNKHFIECHARAVQALGDVFGKDDFFTFVELGSLGHWGEWHTNYERGVSHLPKYEVRKNYIDPYIKSFPNAQFLIRYPLIDAKDYGFGYYNDLTGDYDETEYWLKQMKGGVWEQTGLKEQYNNTNVWEKHPIGGEFTSSISNHQLMIEKLPMTLEAIKMSHQSFIGPKIIIDEEDETYSDSIEKILKTIGYKFTINKVQVNLYHSDSIEIDVRVKNKGIAPIYKPCSLKLELRNSENNVIWEKKTNYNLMNLLPKASKNVLTKIKKDSLDDDEQYSLQVSLVDKTSNTTISLALKKKTKNNTYEIAKFRIQ